MSFRTLSAWSIRNPIPPIVLFVAVSLAGIMSFLSLPVTLSPDVSLPWVQITVTQPGAAPNELETQVTQKVESAVRNINGVNEIGSVISDGQSFTNVEFDVGTPIDRAVNDVSNAVAQIRPNLPDGILEPHVQRIDAAGEPIAHFSVTSTKMTLEQLSWFIDNIVAKRLLQVPGLAAVDRTGGVTRELRVALNTARMEALGITAAQVNGQLRAANINAAGGRTQIAGAEQLVRVRGSATSATQLAQTEINLGAGRAVKLADIATIQDLYGERRSMAIMDGRQALSFSLRKTAGASDVSVFDHAQRLIADLQRENPDVHIAPLFDTVAYTRSQYVTSMQSMVEGALLAIVVVFLFLRDVRSTLVAALAIPLSALPTFGFMAWMGFSLNQFSLLGLSLVSGILVDDAIVEIENIIRHMRMGKTAFRAALDAADEIGLAVLATTMAIAAVFLPVGLLPGISGQYFANFGLPIVFAVLASLAVARMITPMVAAYILQARGVQPHGSGWWMDQYLNLLRWSLAHRWRTVLIGGLGGLMLTGLIATQLNFTLQPALNSDHATVNVSMVPGTTLQQTRAITDQVVAALRTSPAVQAILSDISVAQSKVYVTLKKPRSVLTADWQAQMTPKLLGIADAKVSFLSQSNANASGDQRDISILLSGDDDTQLTAAADALVAQMKNLSEVRGARDSGDLFRPEIKIKPRFDLAAQLGVSTTALGQAIRVATLGEIDQDAAKFSLADRQIPIRVTLDATSRRSIAMLRNLPVATTRGQAVPLSLVADISLGNSRAQIRRINQSRYVSISADLAPGVVSSQADQAINRLPALAHLPQGVERVVAGDTKWIPELLKNFAIALVAGILLVFAVLVLLYQRLLTPFVNILSLLVAPLGAVLALWLLNIPSSMMVLIGLLMLFGIVAKNSILLVDFALEAMENGQPRDDAIIDAGHKRAPPIVMTTIAMVAGMTPTALSLSGDGAWRQPMGVTVIGGLALSTLLTLVLVPAGLSLALDLEAWVQLRLKRYILPANTHAPAE
jgi:multidrug efflux pump subunit AcrB